MRRFSLALYFSFFVTFLFAQTEKPKPAGKIFFSSYIGTGNVKGNLSGNVSSGFQAMTGAEYKFNKHSSIAGEINFDTYGYNDAMANYDLKGSLNTIPLSLFYKYTFGTGKWLPYLKAGGGIAMLSVPVLTQKENFTKIANSNAVVAHAHFVAGLHYKLNPQYLLFTECAWQQYGKLKLLQNQSLQLLAFRIGVSAAL